MTSIPPFRAWNDFGRPRAPGWPRRPRQPTMPRAIAGEGIHPAGGWSVTSGADERRILVPDSVDPRGRRPAVSVRFPTESATSLADGPP